MRTKTILALLPILVSGCITLPKSGGSEPVQPQPVAEKPAPEIFIERYDYEPPSATQIRVGRYSTADAVNTSEQENLLDVVVDTQIPASEKSVGEAIEFLLMRSGYTLAAAEMQGEHVKQLLKKPLPQAHRKVGPVMLKDALMMLVGKAYWMKVDPVHRLIAFDTVKEFK